MLTLKDVTTTAKLSLTKNLVSDQTYQNVSVLLNSGGSTFNSDGLGTGASATSTVYAFHMGGFNDQQIVCSMKYVSPTVALNAQLGPVLRLQSFQQASDQTYYFARMQAGVARITKVVANTFTNLSSGSFAIPQGQYFTVTFSVVGNALTAVFHDESGSIGDASLTANDSSIPSGGLCGVRSLTSTVACKSFTVTQL